tara:strand:+ start:108 stop:572 length:465 start_codon:yes stop_codon:yes gene_type:complete
MNYFNKKTMLWGAGLLILLALIYQYGYLLTGEKAGMQNETSTESQPSTTSSSSPEPSSSDYTAQTAVSGNELLPSNMNSEFVNINPNNGVTMPDMLQAGIHNGLDTVGQTLKNSSLDLRGDVTIPKSDSGLCNVNVSTIEPDQTRRKFEIGCVA